MDDPVDYADLYEQYFPLTLSLVAKYGIRSVDVEDVASEILTKFMEKDYLRIWHQQIWADGTVGQDSKLIPKASFKHWYAKIVLLYLRHHLDKQRKSAHREPVHIEDPVGDTTWGEWYGPYGDEKMYGEIELQSSVEWAAHHMTLNRKKGKRDLATLFKMCVAQVASQGQLDRASLASDLGVSVGAVARMIGDVRTALSTMGWTLPSV